MTAYTRRLLTLAALTAAMCAPWLLYRWTGWPPVWGCWMVEVVCLGGLVIVGGVKRSGL